VAIREPLCGVSASRVCLDLVMIEEDEPVGGSSPGATEVLDLAHRHFDPREWIPCTKTEILSNQMNGNSCCMQQVLQETDVAGLRFAFAANENGAALRYPGTAASHPMCGTPPYTPLRYLR